MFRTRSIHFSPSSRWDGFFHSNERNRLHLDKHQIQRIIQELETIIVSNNNYEYLIADYIDKLDYNEFNNTCLALFHTEDINPPQIYNFIFSFDAKQKLVLRYLITRIKRRIQQDNLLTNDNNFNNLRTNLISDIGLAEEYLSDDYSIPNCQKSAKIIAKQLNKCTLEISSIVHNCKIGSLDKLNYLEALPITYLNKIFANASPVAASFTVHNNNENFGLASIYNQLALIGAGSCWAIAQQCYFNIFLATRQALGIKKRYLLALIKEYYRQGCALTFYQQKYIAKFFAIKRGGLVANLFTMETQSSKEYKNILNSAKKPCQEGYTAVKELLVDPTDELKFFYEIKSELKKMLGTGELAQLTDYLLNLDKSQQKMLQQIAFKLKTTAIRGNLLTHVLILAFGISKTKLDSIAAEDLQLPKLARIVIEIYQKNEEVVKIKSLSYTEIYVYINRLKLNNYQQMQGKLNIDYEAVILNSLQNIVLGVSLNLRLNRKQKDDLIMLLNTELEKVVKQSSSRPLFYQNLFLGIAAYSFRNLAKVEKIFDPFAQKNQISTGGALSSATGWACYSLASPFSKAINNRSRQTLKSGNKICSLDNLRFLDQVINLEKHLLYKNEPQLDFNPGTDQNLILDEIIDKFVNYLKQGEFELLINLIREYSKNNPLLLYMIFAAEVEEVLFLNLIVENIPLKYTRLTIQCWCDCSYQYIRYTDLEWFKKHNINITSFESLANLSERDFRLLACRKDFNDRQTALAAIFRIIPFILADSDKRRKAYKLQYLTSLIKKAKNDRSSHWYELFKADPQVKKYTKIGLRVAIFFLICFVSCLLVGLPWYILVAVLAFLFVLEYVTLRSTSIILCAPKKTKEYQLSKKLLSLVHSLSFPNQVEIIARLKKSTAEIRYKPMLKVIKAGEERNFLATNLIVKGKNLADFFRSGPFLSRDYLSDEETYIARLDKIAELANSQNQENIAITYLSKVINRITDEGTGKYYNSIALMRVVRIIYLSKLGIALKLKLLGSITFLFSERALIIAKSQSIERDFLRRKNYFIPEVFAGIADSIESIFFAPKITLRPLYRTLFGGGFDLVSSLVLSCMANKSGVKNNTTSFNDNLKFLKYVLVDLLLKLELNTDLSLPSKNKLVTQIEQLLQLQSERCSLLREKRFIELFRQLRKPPIQTNLS